MKKRILKILKILRTTYLTNDQVLIYKQRAYTLWNFHYYIKTPFLRRIIYYWDSIMAFLFEMYAILHDDDEGHNETVENEEEVDDEPDIGETSEDNINQLTPLEEIFEDIFNLNEVAYTNQNKREEFYKTIYSHNKRIPTFYYEGIEDLQRWETCEGEILGGALTNEDLDDTYYTDQEADFGNYMEAWGLALALIPISAWCSTHTGAIVYSSVVLVYIFYQSHWDDLKAIELTKEEKEELAEEEIERQQIVEDSTKPIASYLRSYLGSFYYKVYEELPIQITIMLVSPLFITVPVIGICSNDYSGHWKEIGHEYPLYGEIAEAWVLHQKEAPTFLYYILITWTLMIIFLLPANAVGIERSYIFDRDAIGENHGMDWRNSYNLIRLPHVTWPSNLGMQMQMEGALTSDLDWLIFRSVKEKWQIWTRAFSYYLMENKKNVTKADWEKWKRWAEGEKIEPTKEYKFDDGQFSIYRILSPFIFKFVTNPLFSFNLQEPFQKWDSCHLRENEIESYKELKAALSKSHRLHESNYESNYGEETITVSPGAYAIYKRIKKIKTTRKQLQKSKTLEEFLKKFEAAPIESEKVSELELNFPKLTDYQDWAIKRTEQIKKKMRKKKSMKRSSRRIFPMISKLIFYLFGKVIAPSIFFLLKLLSLISLCIYILRIFIERLYKKIQKPIEFITKHIIVNLFIFVERRVRGYVMVTLFPVVLVLIGLYGRNSIDWSEDDEAHLSWGVDELAHKYFHKLVLRIIKDKILFHDNPMAWARHMQNYGTEKNNEEMLPLMGPLNFYHWYFHWYRRELLGFISQRHGLQVKEIKDKKGLKEEKKMEFTYDMYEERFEENYKLHLDMRKISDYDVIMSQKFLSVKNGRKRTKRGIFERIPQDSSGSKS